MTTRETKTASAPEIRLADDQAGTFTGYASVFGEPDSYGDTIKPGAFAKTIREAKSRGGVSLFWNHDSAQPIGVWSELVEDAKGLKVTGRLVTETMRGAEALALLKAGAISGLSIGFRARKSERGPNGGRILTDIELVEISLVSLPAASKARVHSVRNDRPRATIDFVAAVKSASRALQKA